MNLYDIGLFLEKNLLIVCVVTLIILLMLVKQYNLFMFRLYKRKIAQYYSEDELIQVLGRDKVIFPIVGQNDKIPVRSLNLYKKDYLYGSVLASPMGAGLQQGSILDKSGKKYILVRKKLKEFSIVPDEIRNLIFEGVELISDELIDFATMKKDIMREIEDEGMKHPYYEVKENIQKSQSIEELTDLMDSVPH
ncbi:hypothetical protein XF24_00296 [candidate division SR1 bacterium Aalborg_AAW-1]|nr:hypothetical protein XF24_00296 [candidate division SR1 bacterium Aalborg_AAW-1]